MILPSRRSRWQAAPPPVGKWIEAPRSAVYRVNCKEKDG
ncbi:hypothetical protein SFOMI_3176 [Sphingobium fuliginis]|uniref:Uncharacterized protein n=1 Tax=Sphingobium fuliginis (strain ATCC 27551) TaxID=336203 RepID=A0A292ZGP6_SPHSA|nr:hypothetical protein SFOMI_3176 [Sphingobium fuliginis]